VNNIPKPLVFYSACDPISYLSYGAALETAMIVEKNITIQFRQNNAASL